MDFQPGLSISPRESDMLKAIGFTWLTISSIRNDRELLQRNKRQRPPFFLLRLVLGRLCLVASTCSVIRAIWHLMS